MHQPRPSLHTFHMKEKVTADFRQEASCLDRKRYKALTLHGKQLVLKHDRSQSHRSAPWLPPQSSSWQRYLVKLF